MNRVYGPMIHPWFTSGPNVYLNVSQGAPYNAFTMVAPLPDDDATTNLLTDPGFEEQTPPDANGLPSTSPGALRSPWCSADDGGALTTDAHAGATAVMLGAGSLTQTIAVTPGAAYVARAFVKANGDGASLVARTVLDPHDSCPAALGDTIASTKVAPTGDFTEVELAWTAPAAGASPPPVIPSLVAIGIAIAPGASTRAVIDDVTATPR